MSKDQAVKQSLYKIGMAYLADTYDQKITVTKEEFEDLEWARLKAGKMTQAEIDFMMQRVNK